MYSDDEEEPVYRSVFMPAGFAAAPPLLHFPPAPFPSRQSSMELLAATPGVPKQNVFAAAPTAACGVSGAGADPADAPTPAWLSKQNTIETDFHDVSASSLAPVLFHPGSAPLTPPRSRTRSPPNEAAVSVRRHPSLPAATSVVVTSGNDDDASAVPAPPLVARSGSWPPSSPRRAFGSEDACQPKWEVLATSQRPPAPPAPPTAAAPRPLPPPPPAPSRPPVSPPPTAAEAEGDLDCLSRTLAQLRVETRALRARYQASTAGLHQITQSNADILSALQHDSSASPPPVAASGGSERSLGELSELSEYQTLKESSRTEGATIVVDPGCSDEDDEDDGHSEEEAEYQEYVEDGATYIYRSLGDGGHGGRGGHGGHGGDVAARAADGPQGRDSAARSRAATAAATALAVALSPQQSMGLSNGKRARSFTHELASEPLHASKQASEALSRGDPSAERLRVEQLRGMIAAEQREREALLQAFRANESMLQELQAANAKLVEQLGQLTELKRRRQAANAPDGAHG